MSMYGKNQYQKKKKKRKKIIPKKNKCKKAKWLSKEALQIAEKRKEAKGKGGNEKKQPFKCDPMDCSKCKLTFINSAPSSYLGMLHRHNYEHQFPLYYK